MFVYLIHFILNKFINLLTISILVIFDIWNIIAFSTVLIENRLILFVSFSRDQY